jgi:peptide deformylase
MTTEATGSEERREAAFRQIRQIGDPILRTPALPVEAFDGGLDEEITRLIEIMHAAEGVGLAAPQVGSLRRLLVARPERDEQVVALCNPSVVWRSEEEEIDTEGCLSIRTITAEVPRAVSIRVEALDPEGNDVEIHADGFAARVLQHEIDHLDGILILDRATPESRREALRALRDSR